MEELTIVTKTAVHQAVLTLMRLVKRHRITPISLFSVYNSLNYCKDSLRLIQAYDIFLKFAFFLFNMMCKLHTKYKYLNRLPTRTRTSQFHSHCLSSTHRFHTRTTPFQQPKSLSSTPKTLLEVIILRNLSKINKIYIYLVYQSRPQSSKVP